MDWSDEMATEVIFTDEFGAWYEGLSEAEQERVYRSVGLLEAYGVTLPFPHSSAIEGASFALRELRAQVRGDPRRGEAMEGIPRGNRTNETQEEVKSDVWPPKRTGAVF